MKRLFTLALAVSALAFLADTAGAQEEKEVAAGHEGMHGEMMTAPPGGAFQPVSELVELPDFLPGIGTLYVDPATLPAGPFLAYDRDGKLVSSVYMIPLSSMNEQENFNGLDVAAATADHVDIYYNAGHPGVAEPHYHFVVWYVSPEAAAALK
ncbi:MAG: hypothetical protein ACREMD_09925 [Gemmatimonadota bacterium]